MDTIEWVKWAELNLDEVVLRLKYVEGSLVSEIWSSEMCEEDLKGSYADTLIR